MPRQLIIRFPRPCSLIIAVTFPPVPCTWSRDGGVEGWAPVGDSELYGGDFDAGCSSAPRRHGPSHGRFSTGDPNKETRKPI
jgi:hypothetical protein